MTMRGGDTDADGDGVSGGFDSEDVPTACAALSRELARAREYTLSLYADLPADDWIPARFPYLPIINPPLWELGHIAYFAEFFCLRWQPDDVNGARTPSRRADADALFNSNWVPHAARWRNAYPSRAAVEAYMADTLADVLAALAASAEDARYCFQLALLHEDMHAEALAMTRATLGRALPMVPPRPRLSPSAPAITAGGVPVRMGRSTRAFRFDNEDDEHEQYVAPFEIDAMPVTARDLAAFRRSADYRDDRLWSAEGAAWRQAGGRASARDDAEDSDLPALHVGCFEAEAYAAALGRRLPSEAEWECAATHSTALRESAGQVWEWTASAFLPRAGFAPGPYAEYSAPWFGTHRVLKGGSFVTHPRLKYPQYRNFYTPDRCDPFAGFRTCRSL